MNKKNKIVFIITLLVAFCMLPIINYGQVKSNEIKTLNGKKYYIHKVEKGQSLYAIAKTYSIDVNSILAENDDAIDGLKTGQELKIPFESLLPKQQSIAIDTNKYFYHKVLKAETLYGICKKYNTDEEKLSSYNPTITKGIKEGEYLIIGEKKKVTSNSISQTSQNTYTVQQGETLYGLSKKLNISIDDIIKWNPEAKDGIKEGQTLKISSKRNVDETKTILTYSNTINTLVKDSLVLNKPKKTNYNVGLFLPFKLAESESISIEELLRSKSSFPNAQSVALDFYFGFKKAVDSLNARDFDVSISIFDVQERDSAKVESICKTAEFKKLDMVFGPIYSGVFKHVSASAKALGIPAILPITQQSKILYNNPLVSKVNPSQYTIIESLADFCIDSLAHNSNIIIVNSTTKDQPYVKAFKKRYNENLVKIGKSVKDSIVEVKGLAGVKSVYVAGKKNVVVLLTNSPVYLQDFITQLSLFSNKKDFDLLGFESITTIDNLDQGYLNDLNFHFATANHIDYTLPATIDLVKQYQQFYYSDPSDYYFQGFDIANFYLSNLKKLGPNYFSNLEQIKGVGLSCGFKFWRPDNTTGYENKAVSIYKYSNYKLQKLGW